MEESMGSIQDAVLNAIREDGGRTGIAFYKRYAQRYESLQHQEACLYWRQIFRAIEEKERISAPSLLSESDPWFNQGDSFSMSNQDIRDARNHRRTYWQKDDSLDAKMVNFILWVYDHSLELHAKYATRRTPSVEPFPES